MSQDQITELFDKEGNCIGALLTAEAWLSIKPVLAKEFGLFPDTAVAVKPEPLSEWENLLAYWDFPYPPDYDVHCEACGNHTEDWSKDDPRLFRLRAASLSGLVTFLCQKCQARIIKKHFKDEILAETHPFQPEKDPVKEARYQKP
ncbi:MAG: hypothetical protein V3573_13685 [Desulfovibrionaceae bacterium]